MSPVNCNDDPCSEEVRVLCRELPGDILVGLHGPGSVVGAAVQLVNLSTGRREQQSMKRNSGAEPTQTGTSLPYLWKERTHFQEHDVVRVELGEALVVIVSEDGGVSDQTPQGAEGLFERTPHHILTGVRCLRILIREKCQVPHDAERNDNI